MSEYRKWDESRSPQWKYLLQKEAVQRRKTRREIDHERRQTQEETVGKGKGSFKMRFAPHVRDTNTKKSTSARKVSKQELQEKLKYQAKQKKFNTTPEISYSYDVKPRPTTRIFTESKEQE